MRRVEIKKLIFYGEIIKGQFFLKKINWQKNYVSIGMKFLYVNFNQVLVTLISSSKS